MTYHYVEIATALFECLLLHIFFSWWFGTRNDNRLKTALFIILYFMLHTAVSLIPLNPIFRAIIGYFLVLGIAALLYKTSKPSAVYSSLLYMALAILSEYLCLVLMNVLNFDTAALLVEGYPRAIYMALAKTVHFMVVLIVASTLRKNRAALALRQVAPLLPCLIVSVFICVGLFRAYPDCEDDLSLTLLMALIGLLYVNGIVVFNTQSIKNSIAEIEEQKLANQHYEMQLQYYSNVVKHREETCALWHDLKKHIVAIEALVDAGNTQSAKSEYEQIRQAIDDLGNIVDTENTVLNAILHHNIERAKSHGIAVRLDAEIPSEILVSAVDLSIIIGNTFDNAIDECTAHEVEDPAIDVSIVQQNHMLFYEITNPCMPIARKKAGKHHGYGLENVRRCVEKYHGAVESGASDGHYQVSVRLNCPHL